MYAPSRRRITVRTLMLFTLALMMACGKKEGARSETPAPGATQTQGESDTSRMMMAAPESASVATVNSCGDYPNCQSSFCQGGKKCQCKKNDETKTCSPTSCIADKDCP